MPASEMSYDLATLPALFSDFYACRKVIKLPSPSFSLIIHHKNFQKLKLNKSLKRDLPMSLMTA